MPLPAFRMKGNIPHITSGLQFLPAPVNLINQQVAFIIDRDITVETTAKLCLPLGVCPLEDVLVPNHGVPVLYLMYLQSGRVIFHHYLAYRLRPESVGLTGYRDCILVFCCSPRFPAAGCPIRISLLPVIGHII